MREGLQIRYENWLMLAKVEAQAGHYREAAEAQLLATELKFVLDQWLATVS